MFTQAREVMKKIFKVLIIFFLLGSILSINSFAKGDKSDELWEEFVEIAPEGSVSESIDESLYSVGVESIFAEILASVGEGVSEISLFLMMLIGIAVLISVADVAAPLEISTVSRHTSVAVTMIT